MENVMLNSIQTQIKIVDFGLSNFWSKDQMLQTHCGSPEYAAPELFVSGKQYGPEVDLWSLGIILYGMVVGQLPFVCEKRENLSSQERRKNLIMQINRGLATNQKRALATFSTDFRHLVNSLLNADAAQRLTVKGLILHPWITEKDKKYIRSNPLKGIDKQVQAKIISEISCLCKLSVEQVIQEIKAEKLGQISGIFHILSRRYRMNQLNGDGITKTLSTYVFESYSSRFPSELNTKEIIKLINPGSSRHVRPATSLKPKNVVLLNKKDDKINPPSATLKRKVYSATLHSKVNHPVDVIAGQKYEPVRGPSEIHSALGKLDPMSKEKRPQTSIIKGNPHSTSTIPRVKPSSGRVPCKTIQEQVKTKRSNHKPNTTRPSDDTRSQTPRSKIQEILPKHRISTAPPLKPVNSSPLGKTMSAVAGYISLHSKKNKS